MLLVVLYASELRVRFRAIKIGLSRHPTHTHNCLHLDHYDLLCVLLCRLRHGRAGGSWRHVKEVLQAGGARIVFVDGK